MEADAWLDLLENKGNEISTAEIAVKDKLREVSSTEAIESALEQLEAAKSRVAEPGATDEAKKQLLEAEQAHKEALAAARQAVARVEGNVETARVTGIATRLAAEKAAAEKARKAALGEADVVEQPDVASGNGAANAPLSPETSKAMKKLMLRSQRETVIETTCWPTRKNCADNRLT